MSENIEIIGLDKILDDITISVDLNKIADIKEFVAITSSITGDVVVANDDTEVNGKSLLGIMSLDLSKPVTVKLPRDLTQEEINLFDKFRVDMKVDIG